MTHKISEELASAVQEQGGAPFYLEDDAQNRYVLLPLDQFEKLKALWPIDDLDPREAYASIDAVMKEDWDDPSMDLYDDYDAHRLSE